MKHWLPFVAAYPMVGVLSVELIRAGHWIAAVCLAIILLGTNVGSK